MQMQWSESRMAAAWRVYLDKALDRVIEEEPCQISRGRIVQAEGISNTKCVRTGLGCFSNKKEPNMVLSQLNREGRLGIYQTGINCQIPWVW